MDTNICTNNHRSKDLLPTAPVITKVTNEHRTLTPSPRGAPRAPFTQPVPAAKLVRPSAATPGRPRKLLSAAPEHGSELSVPDRPQCYAAASRQNRAFPDRRKSRRQGPAGFTRSSTTASASSLGGTPRASGCSPATGMASQRASRRSLKRSGVLGVRSCVIDGEAIVVDERGLSVFDALRYRLRDHAAVLCAFDLIELDGEDLRWARLEKRKRTLAGLLRGTDDGIAFNRHFDGDGEIIFRHACALGCEGIVSKRLGSAYRSGRVDHWLKIKNPRRRPCGARRRKIGEASALREGDEHRDE